MVAYLRKNIPLYGAQAVKDDLIVRQGYPRLEVEAACLEAYKPQPTLLKRKPALIVEATACLLTFGILLSVHRPHRPAAAPASALALPAAPLRFAGSARALESGMRAVKSDRFEEALADFDEAARLDPQSFSAQLARASVLNALGRRAEALSALSAAEKIDPTRPEIKQLRELIAASLPPQR